MVKEVFSKTIFSATGSQPSFLPQATDDLPAQLVNWLPVENLGSTRQLVTGSWVVWELTEGHYYPPAFVEILHVLFHHMTKAHPLKDEGDGKKPQSSK